MMEILALVLHRFGLYLLLSANTRYPGGRESARLGCLCRAHGSHPYCCTHLSRGRRRLISFLGGENTIGNFSRISCNRAATVV